METVFKPRDFIYINEDKIEGASFITFQIFNV